MDFLAKAAAESQPIQGDSELKLTITSGVRTAFRIKRPAEPTAEQSPAKIAAVEAKIAEAPAMEPAVESPAKIAAPEASDPAAPVEISDDETEPQSFVELCPGILNRNAKTFRLGPNGYKLCTHPRMVGGEFCGRHIPRALPPATAAAYAATSGTRPSRPKPIEPLSGMSAAAVLAAPPAPSAPIAPVPIAPAPAPPAAHQAPAPHPAPAAHHPPIASAPPVQRQIRSMFETIGMERQENTVAQVLAFRDFYTKCIERENSVLVTIAKIIHDELKLHGVVTITQVTEDPYHHTQSPGIEHFGINMYRIVRHDGSIVDVPPRILMFIVREIPSQTMVFMYRPAAQGGTIRIETRANLAVLMRP